VQLRSASNQLLDLSTLFVCCKLQDDSWSGHTSDVGVSTTVSGDWRCGVDAVGPGKKVAARGASTTAVLRPRDDCLPVFLDKEVRRNK